MFRLLHNYYIKSVDKPSVAFANNLWAYNNVRLFKFKYLKSISVLISFSKGFKNKYLVTLNSDFSFKSIYLSTIPLLMLLTTTFFLI